LQLVMEVMPYKRPTRIGKVVLRRNTPSTRIARPVDFEVRWTEIRQDFGGSDGGETFLPYCIDWESERLLMTRAERGLQELSSPFLYEHQRSHAEWVAAVPLERLGLGAARSTRPVTVVLSIGRCGSTILSAMARALDVICVSEPDVLTNLAYFDGDQRRMVAPETVAELIASCVALLSAPLAEKHYVIKLRARCMAITEQIVTALPHANYVFILRSPESWARSNVRAFSESGDFLVQTLLQGLAAYRCLVRAGVAVRLLWYEDLCQGIEQCLDAAFPWVPKTPARLAAATRAAEQDSQFGSVVSRARLRERVYDEDAVADFLRAWHCARPAQMIDELGLGHRI